MLSLPHKSSSEVCLDLETFFVMVFSTSASMLPLELLHMYSGGLPWFFRANKSLRACVRAAFVWEAPVDVV